MAPGSIKTFGLLLADRKSGPFELHLQSLRALVMSKELSNMDSAPPS
jgi:hypothetical protein